jgi:hypothetical protein
MADWPRYLARRVDLQLSNPILPVVWITTTVKTSNYRNDIGFDAKKERVGKHFQARPAHVPQDSGELPRIPRHVLNGAVDFRTKAAPQTGSLALIPILCIDQFRPR